MGRSLEDMQVEISSIKKEVESIRSSLINQGHGIGLEVLIRRLEDMADDCNTSMKSLQKIAERKKEEEAKERARLEKERLEKERLEKERLEKESGTVTVDIPLRF